MKLDIIKTVIFLFIITAIGPTNIHAQDKKDSTSHHQQMMGKDHKQMMMHDSTSMRKMMEDKEHKMHEMKKDGMHNTGMNSMVHEGVINLKEIDKNNDGKVFQDMMDWNVISDTAGRCPLCNMKLKEVTIDDAKKNLEKNNFKVK